MTKEELEKFFDDEWLVPYLKEHHPNHEYLYVVGEIDNRTRYSWLVANLLCEFLGPRNWKTEPDDWIKGDLFHYRGSYMQVFAFVKFLYDKYRKAFYGLSFWSGGDTNETTKNFKTAIHAYEGDHGYLPHFSDEPDYYYIYC